MNEPCTAQPPTLNFLTDQDKQRLHQAACHILSRVGMDIFHDKALNLLGAVGCALKGQRRVTIPAELVEKAIQSAPKSIKIFDRAGQEAMDLGGRRTYFGTGSDLLYAFDLDTGERRPAVLDDVRRAAAVCQALKNIDFIMSCAHPSDVAAWRAYLASFEAMVLNSTKPLVCTAEGAEDLSQMWAAAAIIRGGEEAARQKPYLIHYAEPTSPLKHSRTSLAKLLFCAAKEIPLVYSPAPIAGSTAPMTIAGHVALGLAECLCGLVIHQLSRPGAPFIMGVGPAVLDMATSQCSYNAPEYYLSYMAVIEMSHHYDLPSWGYAGTSDSQIPDEQAAFEAGVLTYLTTLAGANLNHDVGYLDFGRCGALEFLVMNDDFIGQARRFCQGVPIDDQNLALEVIEKVGPKGTYLAEEHTFQHFRRVQWRPNLLNRQGWDKWRAQGGKSYRQAARERLNHLLSAPPAPPLPPEASERIRAVVEAFRGPSDQGDGH